MKSENILEGLLGLNNKQKTNKEMKKQKSENNNVQSNQKTGEQAISKKYSISNDSTIRKIFSHILDQQVDEQNKPLSPQTIRVKNNLLLILLVISAYGVYYLIGDFLDVLLVAYIAGIAYHQSKQGFINFITNINDNETADKPFVKRLLKAILWLAIGFTFPRIRYLLANPHKIKSIPTFWDYIYSMKKNQGYIIIVCEGLILMYIIYLLIGPYLKKFARKIRPTNIKFVKFLFALLTILVLVGLVVIVPTVLFKQISSVGGMIQKKVEESLGCQLIYHKQQNQHNLTELQLPLCTDKFSSQNTFIRQTITQFKQQNKTLQQCLILLQKMQQTYLLQYMSRYPTLQKNIYYYDEVVCTWYSFIEKALSYSGITFSTGTGDIQQVVFSTGTNIFKLFFGNLTWFLTTLSNSIFNLTTFVTTFILTIKFYRNNNTIKQIFSQNKQQLISSITNLIQATFFIVVFHFFLSILLLQIFGMTPINLIISTLLASMAMFPFIRPWFGVFIVTGIRMLIYQQYYVSVMFIVLYYILSEKIYSIHYRKMELHEIVTNMSVLFGIYRFGVAGIIYGPLIIITYQCVQRELFKKYPNQQQQTIN